MKVCPNCGAQLDDNAAFCTTCGTKQPVIAAGEPAPNTPPAPQQNPNGQSYQQYYAAAPAAVPTSEYDHTAEFDPKDISDNKVFAMIVYLMGPIGIIIALLASQTSPYVKFHLRQGLKISVVEMLLGICAAILCFTVIVPIAAVIGIIVLLVLEIICFFDVCSGKAREPAIIRSLKFLK